MAELDNKKLALIHILKKELKLRDSDYRNMLKRVTGVTSAGELDEKKFRKLMNYFVRSGYYRINRDGLTLRQKMYIKHLAGNLDWSADHLDNFIHKYYHKSDVDRLTKKEAMKVIESLKNIKGKKIFPKRIPPEKKTFKRGPIQADKSQNQTDTITIYKPGILVK